MAQAKIVGIGKLRVNIRNGGSGYPSLKRIVKTKGVLDGEQFAAEAGVDTDTVQYILDEISRIVKAGYEVRLGADRDNGVRFFPLLNSDCSGMKLIAQSIGSFRDETLKGAKFELYRKNKEISCEEAGELVADNKKRKTRICITPDKMVTCPKCGTEFRIGKLLESEG